jgi:hypothetical protein
MAKQTINVGTNELAGDGESLRTAFQKINSNFNELYSTGTVSTGTGFTGSQGITGFTGSEGSVGFTGSRGFQGQQGNVGFTGSAGSAGSQGSVGFTGSAGNVGFTGSAGNVGFTGSEGSAGSQGNVGFTGSAGSAGSQGNVGFTGSAGSTPNFSAVGEHILPATDITYDLGSPSAKFRSLYLSTTTIYLGENSVSVSNDGQLLVNGASAISSFERFVGETSVPWNGPESDPVGSSVTAWLGSKLIITNPGAKYKQALYDLKVGSIIQADYPGLTPSKEWSVVGSLEEYPDTITVGLTPIAVKRFEIEISENTTATSSAINYPEFIYLPVMEKSATLANGTWTISLSAEGGIVFPDSSTQSGASISITDLKTLVAASTDFADFKSRIAAL